ncbi:hypothetical protein POM88_025080 [Heracleum sosnowskyi]|uniref:PHD-type domain-containing protein n=1 Tax=Heracleum sosnowskyi TaxID=360622 RepID=A0AAD8I3N4_9APIA|nr:hypothetical protein POM88_025080 [Heracleum sosnowskyi]
MLKRKLGVKNGPQRWQENAADGVKKDIKILFYFLGRKKARAKIFTLQASPIILILMCRYHLHDSRLLENTLLEDTNDAAGSQVCDTCGDIGCEYLLVVCCRCSDGVEHTYCMPKMLDKIPESGWMCQECKMEETKSRDNDNCDERKDECPSMFKDPELLEADGL